MNGYFINNTITYHFLNFNDYICVIGDLAKANDQLKDITYYFNKTKSEVATLKSTVEHLQQLNRDKLDEIAQ